MHGNDTLLHSAPSIKQNKTVLYSDLNVLAQPCYLDKNRLRISFSAHHKYWYDTYISTLYQVAKIKHYPIAEHRIRLQCLVALSFDTNLM